MSDTGDITVYADSPTYLVGNYEITVTVTLDTGTYQSSDSFVIYLEAVNPCTEVRVTFPEVEDQSYTVGDELNGYRFNLFTIWPDYCGIPQYYYSIRNEDQSLSSDSVISMFQVHVFDDEPRL